MIWSGELISRALGNLLKPPRCIWHFLSDIWKGSFFGESPQIEFFKWVDTNDSLSSMWSLEMCFYNHTHLGVNMLPVGFLPVSIRPLLFLQSVLLPFWTSIFVAFEINMPSSFPFSVDNHPCLPPDTVSKVLVSSRETPGRTRETATKELNLETFLAISSISYDREIPQNWKGKGMQFWIFQWNTIASNNVQLFSNPENNLFLSENYISFNLGIGKVGFWKIKKARTYGKWHSKKMSSGFGRFSDGNRNIVDFLLHTLSLFTHTIKCLSINKAIFSKIDLGTPGTSIFSIFKYFCGGHGGCSFQALLLVSRGGGSSSHTWLAAIESTLSPRAALLATPKPNSQISFSPVFNIYQP